MIYSECVSVTLAVQRAMRMRHVTPSSVAFPDMAAYKSLARPTSRCILFDGENISFEDSLVIYIYIYIYTHINIYIYI